MNKIIMVEGPDRVGKDTQIKLMLKDFSPMICLKGSNIPGLTNEEQQIAQFKGIKESLKFLLESVRNFTKLNFIQNRSHLGEYIYGKIYRGYDADYIFDIEYLFQSFFPNEWRKIYLITLIDKPENLIERDDGLSFSTDLDKKKIEIKRFIAATSLSLIQHKLIVDICGKNPQTIHNMIMKFLKPDYK